MTTRYYKLSGSNEYVTWDYLHNTLGYSTSATEAVGYKSVVNWGTGAGTGYCTDTTDYESEWFVQGETGWAGLNGLAWGCNVYPSSATDIKVERSGTESNAASMTFDNVEYWLVESEIGDAWWPRSRWEQQGWAIVEEHTYDFILVDSTTGRITYGVENLTEIEFTPTGYFTIDEGNEVVFVEQSPFPVVCIDEGTRTPESIAPDASFDTELPYYDSKLYIITTDDGQDETLYGWEAEEGIPVVALPAVTEAGYVSIYPNHSNFYPDVVNEGRVWDYSSSQWVESSYDSTKTYAAVDWSAENSQSGFYGIQISEYNGHLGLKNVLSKIIERYIESKYAVCDSASASVVAVYGNGVIYNAFKYTANNTDYYYVLDGTQTNWTDNLSGLGYVLYTGEIEILLGFKWNDAGTELVSVNDLSNDYYWARVISQADRDLLSAMGIASNIESYLKYGGLLYNSYYTYSFVAIYSDMGETVAPLHDPSNCLIRSYSSGVRVVIGLYYDGTSSEAVMTWKCRITRNS